MSRFKEREQLVNVPGHEGAYYKVDVFLSKGTKVRGEAYLPDVGRVKVEKKQIPYTSDYTFDWFVVEKYSTT